MTLRDLNLSHSTDMPSPKYAAPPSGHDLMAMFPPPPDFPKLRARPMSAVAVTVDNFSRDDIIIAVMGPTGAGKSSFINLACGFQASQLPTPQRADIQAVRITHPTTGKPIVFVDTPGFDDSSKSDVEILQMMAQWLEKTYKRRNSLAGIINMHSISNSRMPGSTPQENLQVFANLCGGEAMRNVILATTMWNKVREDVGARRETKLKEEYWKPMLEKNSSVVRFYGTSQSAWGIVDEVLRSPSNSSLDTQ